MTPFALTSLEELRALPVDTVIDVRAPAEFAEDHVPGAINLPVLDDAERARVGTLYKQVSPFDARKLGGALVAQNTARHLRESLSHHEGGWQPLVYCWRGGQRSGAFATILDQVGWRVLLLKGGYRSYRRLVVGALYDNPLPHRVVVIEGGTGTAKTALLQALSEQGAQIIDLEGLANHRGSLFGAMPGGQPAQKMFESRLAAALSACDPARPTYVEAESSKVGDILVPPSVWGAMLAAPRLAIEAPLTARATYLARAYRDLTEDAERLTSQIDALRPYHARDLIARWHELAGAEAFESLAGELVDLHYDPRYAKSASDAPAPLRTYALPVLDEASLRDCAARIISDAGHLFPAPAGQ
ncbi:MAG: tRNA 2-selenouridine(34) synthase MnmH [Sulfitobacter sp.]|nr:tRNA 2-selenouridine(34) synthase MnmH [Sulfitobacter sp.]